MGRPKLFADSTHITINLESLHASRLRQIAHHKNVSLGHLVREILLTYLSAQPLPDHVARDPLDE